MPAQEFGCRVDHIVRAEPDRLDQIGGGKGRVDDERDPMPVGDPGDPLDVRDIGVWVADRLHEKRPGLIGHSGFPRVQIAWIHKPDLDPDPVEGDAQQVDRAAVNADRRDDLVPRIGKVEHRVEDHRMSRRHRQRAYPSVKRSDPPFERIHRRIVQTGVDVARLFQFKQTRCMVNTVEGVSSGLDDRLYDRMGHRIGLGPGVHHQRVKSQSPVFKIQHVQSSCRPNESL